MAPAIPSMAMRGNATFNRLKRRGRANARPRLLLQVWRAVWEWDCKPICDSSRPGQALYMRRWSAPEIGLDQRFVLQELGPAPRVNLQRDAPNRHHIAPVSDFGSKRDVLFDQQKA